MFKSIFLATMLAITSPPLISLSYAEPVKVYSNVESNRHGSGFTVGENLVVTAAHVVKGLDTLQIGFEEQQELLTATVVIFDNTRDLAVLRITEALPENFVLTPDTVSCEFPQIGEEIHGVGSPAFLDFIHTWGYVASTTRSFERQEWPWSNAYVADMQVFPGMSGGPVYNTDGEVVGVINGILADTPMGTTGFSFIQSSQEVCELLDYE